MFLLVENDAVIPNVVRHLVEQAKEIMNVLLQTLSPAVGTIFSELEIEQMFELYVVAFMPALMFLIMPLLMFSPVVGADAFIGKRERKTLEALLYSPATDMELFLRKVLAAVILAFSLSRLTYLEHII